MITLKRLLSPAGRRIGLSVLSLLLAATAARADAISPLVMAGVFHLFIGNFAIGVGEILVTEQVLFLFRVPPMPNWTRGFAIIGGNYTSCFYGIFLSVAGNELLTRVASPLNAMLPVMVGLTLASFLLSVLVEWCFFYAAIGPRPNRLRLSLWTTLIAQVASYAVLIPIYGFFVGSVSLYTQAKQVVPGSSARQPGAVVYYVNPDDRDVWRIRPDGTGRRRVSAQDLNDTYTMLFVTEDAGKLWLSVDRHFIEGRPRSGSRLFSLPPGCRYAHSTPRSHRLLGTQALEFDTGKKSDWTAGASRYAKFGLEIRYKNRDAYKLALSLPFLSLLARCPTQLPDDQLVAQIGDEIVLLDMPTRRFAVLARGRGPAVVLEPAPVPTTNTTKVLTR